MPGDLRQQPRVRNLKLTQALAGDGAGLAVRSVIGPVRHRQQELDEGFNWRDIPDFYKDGGGGDQELIFDGGGLGGGTEEETEGVEEGGGGGDDGGGGFF